MIRTYGSLSFSQKEKAWVIKAEPHVNIRLKDVFRKINKNSINRIEISHSDQTAKDLKWFMMRYPFVVSDDDQKILDGAAQSYDHIQQELERIMLPDYVPTTIPLAKPLRPYQGVAVDLVLKNKRLLCGDETGLGKTIIGLAIAAGALDAKPGLIVCQTHLPPQWKEKIEEFLPGTKVHIIKTRRAYSLPEADIYIMSYSKLIGWTDIFRKGFFKSAVFDEIQELRINGSSKYDAAKALCQSVNYALGMSATPVYNYGGEIYNIMDLLIPGCLGTWPEFKREWCVDSYGNDNKVKVKDPDALGSFLRENFLMIRRTRKDVGKELPAINQITHYVEYDEEYVENAKKDLKQIAARVLSGEREERGEAALMLDVRARMMTGIAKAKGVADYVKLFLENGEKLILAGWHREVYEIWTKELQEYNPVFYTGEESPTQKKKSVDSFVSGESQLFIISLRSGVGIDGLQEVCDIVVFGELDWSPGVHKQVRERIDRDRKGEQKQVTAIYLVTENGTDPLMIDILGLKASQASGIMNPGQEVASTHTDDNRIRELAKNILEA